MYRIERIEAIGRDIWDSYVENNEHGTIFHTYYMYEVWRDVSGYEPFAFCVIDEKRNISALLSGFIQTIAFGLLENLSRRSILLQAPLYDEPDALKALLEVYREFSAKKRLIYTEVRNHYFRDGYNALMLGSGYKWEGHYNIIKELPDTVDLLRKDLSKKRRGGVNKALKEKFTLEVCSNDAFVVSFYKLLETQYKNLRLPCPPIAFFENCVKMDASSNCYFFNLLDNGKVKISELAFVYKDTIHLLYIGIEQEPEFLNKRPVDLFHFFVMQWCIENEVKHFDWMGAGKPGVEYGVRDFKLQYGGELTDYGRYKHTSRPLLLKLSTLGFNTLKMAKKYIKL